MLCYVTNVMEANVAIGRVAFGFGVNREGKKEWEAVTWNK